jgi:hypothetical protein
MQEFSNTLSVKKQVVMPPVFIFFPGENLFAFADKIKRAIFPV